MGKETTIAARAERLGIKTDTVRKRWGALFPSVPFDRYAEITDADAEKLFSVRKRGAGISAKSVRKSVSVPAVSVFAEIPTRNEAEKVAGIIKELEANERRAILEEAELDVLKKQPNPPENAQDLRVKLCRWLLWSITACQIFLVFVGCIFRFGGLVGLFVAFIPSAFLVAANAVAGDARFFDSTETAKISAFFLSAVFGYLHFLTFRDVVMVGAEMEFWFSVVSATVVEVVAFSAIVLQQKISSEK